jgi:two-component system sensor histidine kinase UhpB
VRATGLGAALGGAVHRIVPPATGGLDWPRHGDRGRPLSDVERARLLHYERLMGLAHLTAVPVAFAATLVHVDFVARPATPWFLGLLGIALVFAVVYHFLLPRIWLSHSKVVLGLLIDVALTTEVVRLTGYHMSLLLFLYYLIIIACALTLETRTLYAICLVISLAFCAVLPVDPVFLSNTSAHLGHVLLFLFSVWGVGFISAAGAAQIQTAERRLMRSVRAQRVIAEENAQLSVDLARRLEESRALTASLDCQREEIRRLADMVIHAQEEERRRVARELHDEANQLLAALMTTVDAAEAAAFRHGHPELTAVLGRLRRLAGATLTDLQRIATELRPPALDEFGLLPALTRHVRDRTEGTGLAATVDTEGRPCRLPPTVEVALYRIAQEALANVQKHSRATTVRLRLCFLPDAVRLDVDDDGVGFAPEDGGPGGRPRLGIAGMRERASIVGGTVTVASHPGLGTRISAGIPLREERTAEPCPPSDPAADPCALAATGGVPGAGVRRGG